MNDLTPNDLSHLSEAEFQALCPQGEHAPGPEPLSTAAETVLAAFNNEKGWVFPREIIGSKIAAALRAAADQVVPEPSDLDKEMFSISALRLRWVVRDQFLAIAAELEGA